MAIINNPEEPAKQFKLGKLSISTIEGIELVPYSSILYLESENSYTTIYVDGNRKIVSTKNLGFYESELREELFYRLHNSYIINLTKVTKYIKADEGYVILTNNKPIRVSRSKRDELVSILAPGRK